MTLPVSDTSQTGLALATPADWVAVSLPGDRADARALAAQLGRARPGLAASADLEDLAAGLVDSCAVLDVLAAYATVLDVQGQPLVADLVVSVRPLGGYTLDAIDRELSESGQNDVLPPVAGKFDLPAGPAVRAERIREWPPLSDGRRPVSLIVQYVIATPASGMAVMLTFGSPAVGLASHLRVLFHRIACTVRFDTTEPPQ